MSVEAVVFCMSVNAITALTRHSLLKCLYQVRRDCSLLHECEWYHSLTPTLLIEVPVQSQERL